MRGQEGIDRLAQCLDAGVIHPHEGSGDRRPVDLPRRNGGVIHPHEGSGDRQFRDQGIADLR